MSNLSRLSIVIPTYERQIYALRNMRYWSNIGVTVHVLDGSEQAINPNELIDLNSNIHYYHMPISVEARLAYAPLLVNTEFVTLLSDDEFFLPSGLEACIREIESNDLVACLGRCLCFSVNADRVLAYPWEPPHTNFKNYQLLDDNPQNRVIAHMNPYLCTTIYAVTKVDVWENNIAAYGSECSSYDANELGYEMACSYQGKSKVINTLMWIRSDENPPSYGNPKSKEYYKPTAHVWYREAKYNDEHEKYFTSITDVLSTCDKARESEIHKILEEGMKAYVYCAEITFENKHFLGLYRLLKHRLKFLLRRFVPNIAVQLLKRAKSAFIKKNCSSPQNLDLIDMAKYWMDSGIKSNIEEVTKIQNIIKEFHLKK
jgi:glycosyltransferase domain-containing protein